LSILSLFILLYNYCDPLLEVNLHFILRVAKCLQPFWKLYEVDIGHGIWCDFLEKAGNFVLEELHES